MMTGRRVKTVLDLYSIIERNISVSVVTYGLKFAIVKLGFEVLLYVDLHWSFNE